MENRMRDLDQIQERDIDERGRRMGAILLATLAVVGLTFAIGVVVGRAAEPRETAAGDPLQRLGDTLEDSAAASARDGEAGDDDGAGEAESGVDAAELSFPNTLTEQEDRPEVLAALQAAAREEAALGASSEPTALPGASAVAAAIEDAAALEATAEAAAPSEDAPQAADDDEPTGELEADELVAAVPAAVAAASAGRTLPRDAKHDPMIADAIRNDAPRTPRAARGSDGEYTLQVISYDREAPARAFAEGLRAKGHEAFVMEADVPDRGRYYRVRIGPFKNRYRAEKYRHKFEQEERMNTFVVRKKPDPS